jgi:protein SCO1/2
MCSWKKLICVLWWALLLGVVSCKERTDQKIFRVKGVVKEVLPERQKVKIEHDDIPGYMKAMTMLFDVKGSNQLAGLQPGDSVSFRLVVTKEDGWIDQITKLNTAAATSVAAAPDSFRRVREVEPLKAGDLLPEYHFTNELGQAVNLSDFKGESFALTFIFTRCPFPTFCPRMSSNFSEVQRKLKGMPNAPTNWHLLTITFDPAFDTPAVLKSYAKHLHPDPQHWSFLTGDLVEITAIAEQFGLLFWRPDPKEVTGISHNLRTVVVDARGRVQTVLTENEWKVDDLVAELVKGATVKP